MRVGSITDKVSGKGDKKKFGFLDSLKFVLESAQYPDWDDVKSLSLTTTWVTFLLGATSLTLYLIFHFIS